MNKDNEKKIKVYLDTETAVFFEVEGDRVTDNTAHALFSHALINDYITYEEYISEADEVPDDFYDRLWECWNEIEPAIFPVVASYEELVNLEDFEVRTVKDEFVKNPTVSGNNLKN